MINSRFMRCATSYRWGQLGLMIRNIFTCIVDSLYKLTLEKKEVKKDALSSRRPQYGPCITPSCRASNLVFFRGEKLFKFVFGYCAQFVSCDTAFSGVILISYMILR